MTKREHSHLKMADIRQSDGISVIFDRNSPASSRSRSPSRSSSDSGHSISSGRSKRSTSSGRYRGRSSRRGRYRSSALSRSRSRSHPRCYRPSSRCRCDRHPRYGRGRQSPPRRYRAHSRSFSRSSSPDRRYHSRRNRSRSRSSSCLSRNRRDVSRSSQSPFRSHRSRSRSGSSGQSVNLSLDDKSELLKAVQTNAMTILGVEELELPEGLKPILPEESKQVSPDTWVRHDPEKTLSQSSNEEPDEMFSPKMPPQRKIISFSINNSVVKPTASPPSSVKITSRVDSYESRKPYGQWVRVKPGQKSNARKRSLATSH